jgi:hypothetical protein
MKAKSVLLLLLLFCMCGAARVSAQEAIRARTEAGQEVLLYPDGTWKFTGELKPPVTTAPRGRFNRPASARRVFKTERGNFSVWYDESKWQLSRRANTETGKQSFNLVNGDGYAMIIAEGLSIPMTALKRIALENARMAAPDARIILEEKRIVNGREVLCLKILGTIEQIPFTYYGYYYGGPAGTIQVITFTGQNLFNRYEAEFTSFLNGLEIDETEQ